MSIIDIALNTLKQAEKEKKEKDQQLEDIVDKIENGTISLLDAILTLSK